jgi:putative Mg2+ transporter-C (MgtC) family protein
MNLSSEETLQLLFSLIIGAVIGVEREYSSKAAGFRTMILISIGSTLFTIISKKLGANGNEDRIAANIITGIGFIGAGVVFKDGFSVTGLTTAASIWVTAALGMAIGAGNYILATEGAVLTIIVLFLFEYFQNVIDHFHQRRSYKMVFDKNALKTDTIKEQLTAMGLSYILRAETKTNEDIHFSLDVSGRKQKIEKFNAYLLTCDKIKSFSC